VALIGSGCGASPVPRGLRSEPAQTLIGFVRNYNSHDYAASCEYVVERPRFRSRFAVSSTFSQPAPGRGARGEEGASSGGETTRGVEQKLAAAARAGCRSLLATHARLHLPSYSLGIDRVVRVTQRGRVADVCALESPPWLTVVSRRGRLATAPSARLWLEQLSGGHWRLADVDAVGLCSG
jgi:hypothetical protein